ncbi:MAG: SDR family oxidoreductase [Ilumatobacteraceae bacterium]|jgi:NAD(P)-dependent dehydrogenase (short-subunit alcohol dehydrogenase family)
MGALDGQHVLVTGGSSGIGKACADRYRAEGAVVHVADLNPRSSDELQLDVSDSAAWAALVASLPPLDVVHLNAGITTPGRSPVGSRGAPLSDVTDDAYRAIVGANLDGVFFGARAVLPGMVERGHGHVLVTASMAGLGGMAGDIAYTTTKHAVVGFVRSLGATLLQAGNTGVCVSALCPGFVDTPLVPADAQSFIKEMGLPVIEPARVGDAAMQAIAAHSHGSQWIVWGDIIREHDAAPIELT